MKTKNHRRRFSLRRQRLGDANARLGRAPSSRVPAQIELLHELRSHPSDGFAQHFNHVKWGFQFAFNALGDAKAAGCIVIKHVPSTNPLGGRGRLVASLTKQGKKVLKIYERNQANQ